MFTKLSKASVFFTDKDSYCYGGVLGTSLHPGTTRELELLVASSYSLTSCRFISVADTALAPRICLNHGESFSNAQVIGIFIASGKQME